jgi:hypothetical protein
MQGSGRRGLRRAMAMAIAVDITLLAVACGGSGSPPVPAEQVAYQKELAYSQCMRAHGEPGFPDPQPSVGIDLGPQDHLNGALMGSANRRCQHLLPKTQPLTETQQQVDRAQAVKYALCMRAHGIPYYPDPIVTAQGVHFNPPGGVSKTVSRSATQACRKSLPQF